MCNPIPLSTSFSFFSSLKSAVDTGDFLRLTPLHTLVLALKVPFLGEARN